jgi:acyl-CoA thioester hydrolase
MTAVHEKRLRIRWRDIDAYQHVNNAVYLTYLEECRDAWVHEVMGPEFGFVIVRVAIDYRRELSLEDREVLVTCRGNGYGTSSIRTREQILKTDGSISAEAESVIVAHDPGVRRARPLTEAERATLDAAIEAAGD